MAALDLTSRTSNPHPDAALMAICAEMVALHERRAAFEAPFIASGLDVPDTDERTADLPRIEDLRHQIAAARATTLAGLTAKARAILADNFVEADQDAEDRINTSLARDLAAMADLAA